MDQLPPSLAIVGHPVGHEAAMMPLEELGALRDRQPNVLIVGSDLAVDAVLAEIQPFLQTPVTSIDVEVGSALQMPAGSHGGTVIVRHLDVLDAKGQRSLAEWLATRSGFVQVIATSAAPLLPLVEQGRFSDVLYYRLNTLYIDTGTR
jgi:hypothetical protein